MALNELKHTIEREDKITFEGLRYMIGEVIYGGHITDYWDKRVSNTHLCYLLQNALFEENFPLIPPNESSNFSGFTLPSLPNTENVHNLYIQTITNNLPSDTPSVVQLFSNAEFYVFQTKAVQFLGFCGSLQNQVIDQEFFQAFLLLLLLLLNQILFNNNKIRYKINYLFFLC